MFRHLRHALVALALLAMPVAALAADTQPFQVSPTVTVQNASYSAGNSEGGLITASVANIVNGPWTLAGFEIASVGGSTNTVWVYAWSKAPSATCTDKTAFAASAADKAYLLPGFPIQLTLGGSPGNGDARTFASALNLNVPAQTQDAAATTNAYFCIVTAGSVTPAATTDLSVVISGWH